MDIRDLSGRFQNCTSTPPLLDSNVVLGGKCTFGILLVFFGANEYSLQGAGVIRATGSNQTVVLLGKEIPETMIRMENVNVPLSVTDFANTRCVCQTDMQ